MAFSSHLFLIGYRGSGKTSVGRSLSNRLGILSIDTDALVEQKAGRTIRQIFEMDGEPHFRHLESEAIVQAIASSPSIISLGGGAVLRDENATLIKRSGKTIWLRASAKTLAARMADDPTTAARRPALSKLSVYDEIEQLLGVREPIYRQLADFTVETEGKTPETIADEIANWLNLE